MIGKSRVELLIALALFLPPSARSEEEIRVDRTQLTFRDSGLYCNLGCVHGVNPTKDGVTNLLTAERAMAPDTPWDFYIMQYNASEPSPELAERLRGFARNGKKIILRVVLGKEKQRLDLDEAKRRLEDLLRHTDPDWLYAITLDEENVYWFGGTETLSTLYRYAKERWPGLPVYQWWTPMIAPDVNATRGWVALPADGWVMDLYGRHSEEFEKKLIKFMETGQPVVHIAWASPTWVFHDKEGCTKEDWWARAGRPVFDEQVRICREYNVPVAYFCCQQAEVKDGRKIAPIRWGWHAVDPVTRRWFRELEALVSNFDYLPSDEIGFRELSPRKAGWAHSSPTVRVKVALDEEQRPRFSWQTGFPETSVEPGEHELPCPYDNPYVRVRYVLGERASYLQERFAITSIDKRVLSVPIVFRVEPLRPVADWRVSVAVAAVRPLGGSAKLAFSVDGNAWSDEVVTDPEGGTQQMLTLDKPHFGNVHGDMALWVRVTLCANAGVKTNTASRLTSLTVSASLTP